MGQWIRVAYVEDIPVNQLMRFCVDQQDVIVYRTAAAFHVYANRCTHAAVPLADSYLLNHTVICRLHGAKYDLQTGTCLKAPGRNDLQSYQTKVEEGALYVKYTDQPMTPPPSMTVKSRNDAQRRALPGINSREKALITH